MQIIPTIEPAAIIAGDTTAWRIALVDYPASTGWTLKYRLLAAAGIIDITSTADGDNHLVTITAATSAGYAAGNYQLQKYVEKGAAETLARYTLGSGSITITANLAVATAATDTRSQAKRTLDAIDAVLEKRAGAEDLKLEINTGGTNRRLERIPHADLLQLRGTYARKYWRELNPGKLAPAVNVRFC